MTCYLDDDVDQDLLIQLGHTVLPHLIERPKRESYSLVD